MSGLRTAIDRRSPAYTEAAAAMTAKLAELDAELAKALGGGGAKYVERHHGRGKMTARERIELLLDPDSPFLELCPLAAYGSQFQVGASLVTGIGYAFFFRLQQVGGPVYLSQISYVNTGVGVIFAVAAFHEALPFAAWIAIPLIFAGIALVTLTSKPEN